MDIDKQEMAFAMAHRDEPEQNLKLMGYFNEMADYFANYYHINSFLKEEFKQESIITALKAMKKFDPQKSTPFSYFYKVFSTSFLYWLRREKQKKDNRPSVCSIEKLENTLTDDRTDADLNYQYEYISLNGKPYEKNRVINTIKEAKSIVRKNKLILKHNKIYSDKYSEYQHFEDEVLSTLIIGILEKRKGEFDEAKRI